MTTPEIPKQVAQALVSGTCDDPFRWLGVHAVNGGAVLRAFLPGASRVVMFTGDAGSVGQVLMPHPGAEGLFTLALAQRPGAYRLRVDFPTGRVVLDDPYRFPASIPAHDFARFQAGTDTGLHHWLGAVPLTLEGVAGFRFSVWAPNARRVSVVGDFNGWDGRRHVMRRHHDVGIWELFLPGVQEGDHYKYEILTRDGRLLHKADPLGVWQQSGPQTASLLTAVPHEPEPRTSIPQDRTAPMAIYEVHAGSWRHHDGRVLSYDELADTLIPYVVDMGFTHIEFMPLSEHPFTGSWGYQPTGLFAPTSRFGDWRACRRLVARCHEAGLGVLFDWVPGHFPADAHGLARFDGTALYEHEDPRLGQHPDWGTLIYNYDRHEVRSFLLSSAFAWLERFGFDGIRVDAVASMLYLDYSRREGEWLPNVHGGRENLGAIHFLRDANTRLYANFPGMVSVAEESTAWPGVSHPVDAGGLGFGFKWNMGWMNDTLRYMARDPVHRSHHHGELTFGLHYAFSENYVLPLSHDEVVHGKRSLLGRMPGDRWQQFANLRAYYGFMWAHPGKKLLFMGGEFAQQSEWNHDVSLDWHLLAHAEHRGVQALVRDLNRLYRSEPALHALDCQPEGFQWLRVDDAASSVVAFLRRDAAGNEVVAISNFTPLVRRDYRLGVPRAGYYAEILNTDAQAYGGGNVGNDGGVNTDSVPMEGYAQSVSLTLAPLATHYFRCVPA
ncbi:MAG: 1,4-alpha-glucan branching protein GlgB [Pseudomonadales bacterium]|nr:1,4-alpha-glucan branching protein GlgB [Pseudomonadales bacterium]